MFYTQGHLPRRSRISALRRVFVWGIDCSHNDRLFRYRIQTRPRGGNPPHAEDGVSLGLPMDSWTNFLHLRWRTYLTTWVEQEMHSKKFFASPPIGHATSFFAHVAGTCPQNRNLCSYVLFSHPNQKSPYLAANGSRIPFLQV